MSSTPEDVTSADNTDTEGKKTICKDEIKNNVVDENVASNNEEEKSAYVNKPHQEVVIGGVSNDNEEEQEETDGKELKTELEAGNSSYAKSPEDDKDDEENMAAASSTAGGASNFENDKQEENESDEEDAGDLPQKLLQQLGISTSKPVKREQVLSELTMKGIADFILQGKCKNIVVMTGAGISTAAGIPDFRSPGTGLYSQLEKYNLPYPQSIFELSYFKTNPQPFFLLAKELYPGNFKPTTSHYFICLLEKKKLLLRSYTQNIDGLELVAGIPEKKLIAAHGSFHTSHCVQCGKPYKEKWMKETIFAEEIPQCAKCKGLVKPDIVFFGESLPKRFLECMQMDFSSADLLIVMGTALKVQPFASLIDRVGDKVPRLLINMEKCGQGMLLGGGFDFDSEYKYRDVASLGDCDAGCLKLVELLGWQDELSHLIKRRNKTMDEVKS